MIRTKGFSAKYVDTLSDKINQWLEWNPNFTSLDIQYRVSSMEAEYDCNHCALIIYEDGEDYIVTR